MRFKKKKLVVVVVNSAHILSRVDQRVYEIVAQNRTIETQNAKVV